MNPLQLTPEQWYGYSGGMALYVAHWESVLCLFEMVMPCTILPKLIYYTSLN